jgi:hypothetical protein
VGGPRRCLWRKMHIGIDEQTLEIRAIEVASSSIGDAPVLPDLLNRIPPDQEIGRPRNMQRHRGRGLRYSQMPRYDFCPQCECCHPPRAPPVRSRSDPLDQFQHAPNPRKNAKLWKPDTPGARARNEAVRSSKYLGRASWRQLTEYHRRSRIKTKMHCVKLLGQRLSARDFDRQIAEIQIRAAILNGFTALGIPRTVAIG